MLSFFRFPITKILGFILLVFIVSSCNKVKFKKAQPKSVKALRSFPEEIQGKYTVQEKNWKIDSVYINSEGYRIKTDYSGHFPVKELTEGKVQLKNGLLYGDDFKKKDGVTYFIKNDSVFYHDYVYQDYTLSKEVKLKPTEVYYVLNTKKESKFWDVSLIKIQPDGNLVFYRQGNYYEEGQENKKMANDGPINVFFDITEFKKDKKSGKYILNPTPAEFDALVKAEFFKPQLHLIREGQAKN